MAINPVIKIDVNSAGVITGSPSYDDVTITVSSDTSAFPLGSVDGWCADYDTDIGVPATYTGVKVYSSYEYNILLADPHFATLGNVGVGSVPGIVPVDLTHPLNPYLANLDLVNWLVNNVQVS